MAIKHRKCLCDGVSYSYCPDCSGADRLAPSWKSEFCCEDCMLIWTTATKYNMNLLTKAEAKEIISKIKLQPIEKYADCVQKDLQVIMAEEPKVKQSKNPEPVADENAITIPVVAEIKEVSEDAVVVDVELKPAVRNKAKSKSHEVVVKKKENK